MVKDRIKDYLKIRSGEGTMVLWVSILFFLIQFGLMFGLRTAGSLFNNRVGADKLPYIYIIFGIITAVFALFYLIGLNRLDKGIFFPIILGASGVILLIIRLYVPPISPESIPDSIADVELIYPVLLSYMKITNIILSILMWNVAGEICNARQAKRLFSLFNSSAILGAVVGNFTIRPLIILLDRKVENLLYIQVGVIVISVIIMALIGKQFFVKESHWTSFDNPLVEIQKGFKYVISTKLFRQISSVSVIFMLLYYTLDMPFKAIVANQFDEKDYTVFMGDFGSVIKILTFLAALKFVNWLLNKIGVVNTGFLLPSAYIVGFGLLYFNPSFENAVIARALQLIVLGGIATTVNKSFFNVAPPKRRAQALSFNDAIMEPMGAILAGILLLLGDQFFDIQQLLLFGIGLAFVSMIILWSMRQSYPDALMDAIKHGHLDVFYSDEDSHQELIVDQHAQESLSEALKNNNPVVRKLALGILSKIDFVSSSEEVYQLLLDPDPEVRLEACKTLSDFGYRFSKNDILGLLLDEDQRVVGQIVNSIPKIKETVSIETIDLLKECDHNNDPTLMSQLAITLFELGEKQFANDLVMEILNSEDPIIIVNGIKTVGELIRLDKYNSSDGGNSLNIEQLQDFLDHKSSNVRQATAEALGHLEDEEIIPMLIAKLADEVLGVRLAAAAALKTFGKVSEPSILEVLITHDDFNTKAAALEALEPYGENLFEPISEYSRQQMHRLLTFRGNISILGEHGPASKLLIAYLNELIEDIEQVLLKAVGLLEDMKVIEVVQKGLRSDDPQIRSIAIETLDAIADTNLAKNVLVVLDNPDLELGYEPGFTTETPLWALTALLNLDDPILQALAAKSIAEFKFTHLIQVLENVKNHENPIVKQAVRESIAILNRGSFDRTTSKYVVSLIDRIILLKNLYVFNRVDMNDLLRLAEQAVIKMYNKRDLILEQGEEGDKLFTIVSGKVEIFVSKMGKEITLVELTQGNVIGEMSVIDFEKRSASARALNNVIGIEIGRKEVLALIQDQPDFTFSLMKSLSERIRNLLNEEEFA